MGTHIQGLSKISLSCKWIRYSQSPSFWLHFRSQVDEGEAFGFQGLEEALRHGIVKSTSGPSL